MKTMKELATKYYYIDLWICGMISATNCPITTPAKRSWKSSPRSMMWRSKKCVNTSMGWNTKPPFTALAARNKSSQQKIFYKNLRKTLDKHPETW